MKLKLISRGAVAGVLSLGLITGGAGAALAGTNASHGWCWLENWWDMWKTCNAVGNFWSDGEIFEVDDQREDGHSAVMRIWVGGVRKNDLWDSYGYLGPGARRNMTIPEGTQVSFQLCVGEWSTKTVTACEAVWTYGKA